MAIDPQDVLVELSYVLGAEASRCGFGCVLAEGTPAKIREVFERTVGQALKDDKVWTPESHRYVVKQVGRVARAACRTAKYVGTSQISAEIFEEAAHEVIIHERDFCDRGMEYAKTRAKWAAKMIPLGAFCRMQ